MLLCSLLPAACSPVRPAPCVGGPAVPSAWLVDQGWHTEIGLPASALTGPLAVYRGIFPGATVLMFGFGKRTWMTARVESLGELLIGPFPGKGAIQVTGLRASPERAFGDAAVLRLPLDPSQSRRLAGFIGAAIGRARSGQPRLLSQGLFPGSLFYAAQESYAPDYTCNSWTAQALGAAGLSVDPEGIVFPGGVMAQATRLAGACLARSGP